MTTASFSDLFRLSVAERIQLAQDLWDSVAAEPNEVPLTQEQIQELDRRLEDLHQNPGAGIPWEEVKARLAGDR